MKRLFDVVFAVLVGSLLLPLLVGAALAVKLSSPGSIFYGARRAGRHGKAIRVWKFRTMVAGADRSATVTVGGDARITRVGKWLRATKLDEVPQLLNILRGEMSVVGPRPESLDIVEAHYTEEERETLRVRPGLTCPGNLVYYVFHEDLCPPEGISPNAFYAEHLLKPKLLADLYYVRHQSLNFDFQLMVDTVRILIAKWRGKNPQWTPRFASEPPAGWRGDAFRKNAPHDS